MLGAMMADDILRCKIFASLSLMKISITVHYQCVCVGEREDADERQNFNNEKKNIWHRGDRAHTVQHHVFLASTINHG